MINATSRYLNDSIDTVTTPGRGTHQSVNHALPSTTTINFTWHQVSVGETLDSLAFDLYGGGQFWWKIADINPEIIDWTVLNAGAVIRLPYVQ